MKYKKHLLYTVSFCLMSSLLPAGDIVQAETMTYTVEAAAYEIIDADDGDQLIEMEGFNYMLTPGKPMLPAKTFRIAVPPGAKIISVDVVGQGSVQLDGSYRITPAPACAPLNNDPVLMQQFQQDWQANYDVTYTTDDSYPSAVGQFWGQRGLRKYVFATVVYTPFQYEPLSGRLTFTPSATFSVEYTAPASNDARVGKTLRDTKADKQAEELLYNFDDIRSHYEPAPSVTAEAEDSYNYVIIHADGLQQVAEDYRIGSGMSGEIYITSIDYIAANYSGVDLPDKIRVFLLEKYFDWGIEHVLLLGDITEIPMRRTYPDPTKHNPASAPCPLTDVYYADIGSGDPAVDIWDSDGDGYYGEYEDDLLAPQNLALNVGRIPYNNPGTVESILAKSLAYQADTGSWKENALLMGAMTFYHTVCKNDGGTLMELIIADMLSGWSYTRMYEGAGVDPSDYYYDYPLTQENVVSEWSSNPYGIVTWYAHGSPESSSRYVWATDDGDGEPEDKEMEWYEFIEAQDALSLDDNHPSIVFAASCSNANPEYNNLAKSLLANGAVATVAATNLSVGTLCWPNLTYGGVSAIDYFFLHYLLIEKQTVGQAMNGSRNYYVDNSIWWGSPSLRNVFDFCLYGVPTLSTKPYFPLPFSLPVREDIDVVVSSSPYARVLCEDFDDDNAVDLAVLSYESEKFSILINNGDGTFADPVTYFAGTDPQAQCSADIDGDQDKDLLVADPGTGTLYINRNNGDGTFAPGTGLSLGGNPLEVVAADLDGDTDNDLAIVNYGYYMSIMLNNGDGTYAAAVNYPILIEGHFYDGPMTVADFDRDNDVDIAMAALDDGGFCIYSNNGDGTLGAPVVYHTDLRDQKNIIAVDLDGDSYPDLASTAPFSQEVWVILNDGSGSFLTPVSYPVGTLPFTICSADFDGTDGVDLAVADRERDRIYILVNRGDGTFDPAQSYFTDPSPSAVSAGDLDGDGDFDLVTTSLDSSWVNVLFNLSEVPETCCRNRGDFNHDGTINPFDVINADPMVPSFIGWFYNGGVGPPCVEEADVNGDGATNPLDLIYMVNYLWRLGPAPVPCP